MRCCFSLCTTVSNFSNTGSSPAHLNSVRCSYPHLILCFLSLFELFALASHIAQWNPHMISLGFVAAASLDFIWRTRKVSASELYHWSFMLQSWGYCPQSQTAQHRISQQHLWRTTGTTVLTVPPSLLTFDSVCRYPTANFAIIVLNMLSYKQTWAKMLLTN